jgi:hypothetical protein
MTANFGRAGRQLFCEFEDDTSGNTPQLITASPTCIRIFAIIVDLRLTPL